MYFYHPHTGRFEQSSRSFIRHGYRDPRYKSLDDDVIYTPYRPTIHHLDTYPEEAYTHSQVNRELYLSSAAIEDSYDISNRSRNRDRDVLAAANQAIVDTELHSSPKASVASRRVLRGRSVPPTPVAAVHRVHASEYTSPTFQTPFKQHQEHTTERPNILSWKYRIDAYTPPDDIVFMPRSLDSVRAGVLEAKNKLDRHKQLVDRYLWEPGLSADDRQAFSQCKAYLASRN